MIILLIILTTGVSVRAAIEAYAARTATVKVSWLFMAVTFSLITALLTQAGNTQ